MVDYEPYADNLRGYRTQREIRSESLILDLRLYRRGLCRCVLGRFSSGSYLSSEHRYRGEEKQGRPTIGSALHKKMPGLRRAFAAGKPGFQL